MAFTEKDMQMAAQVVQMLDPDVYKKVSASDPPPTIRKLVEAVRLPTGGFSGDEELQALYHEMLNPNAEYGDWVVRDVCDHNGSTGMFACTIEPTPGQAIVTFRGSEATEGDSFSLDRFCEDWIVADGGMLNNPLTFQQRDAEEYMRYIDEKYGYDSYYTAGFSLGGNLSMHATISATPEIQEKIKGNYSFDSPGFSEEYLKLHAPGIAASEGKLNHYSLSLVSSFLTLPENVIERRAKRKEHTALGGHNLSNFEFDANGNVVRGKMDPTDVYWEAKLAEIKILDHMIDRSEKNREAFQEEYERTGHMPGGMTEAPKQTVGWSDQQNFPKMSGGGTRSTGMTVALRVDPDRLITAARQFESYNGSLGDLTTQMTGLIESLQGTEVWQGEARAAYIGKLAILAGNMTKSRKKISDFISDLKQIADNYKKAESTNVGSVSPLGTDYVH